MPLISKHNQLQVYEHQTLLYKKDGPFTSLHWDALIRYNEKYGNKYFSILHNGVKFSSYVGVIQAGNLTIEILPKTDRQQPNTEDEKSRWRQVLLQMLQQCRLIRINDATLAHLRTKSNSILDIYIQVFLSEVEILLHKGLIKKYYALTKNTTVLKGQLEFNKHLLVNLVHKERFFVRHVVYGYENKFNQILHEALKIIPSLAVSSEVKLRAHNIMLAFPELPVLNITSGYFDKLHFNRGNIHYKPALEIAKMLLLHYRPDIAAGRRPMIAILFDMNELWEEYIFRKLQRLQSDSIQVHRQQSRHFWQADHLPIPRSVIPDIVIHAGNKVIILDTKWKLVPNLTPADTDLKQMFVYNLYWQCDLSILLYPGNQYKKQKGTYHPFPGPVQLPAHCFLATCSVLDENGKLDEHIGVKILSELCGLTE